MKKFNFDIVLPAYNPHVGWDVKVVENMKILNNNFPDINFSLYIVNDGATRGYEKENKGRILLDYPDTQFIEYAVNRGKGCALRYAIERTKSEYVIYTDYDFPYTLNSMKITINSLISGADVVVAVRNLDYQHNLPPIRKYLSFSSHLLNRYFLRLKIKDTQGGLKGFNSNGKEIFLRTKINSFLFDTEFIYKATRNNQIKIAVVDAMIKPGLKVSKMGMKVLTKEFFNLFRIVLNV